MHRRLLGVGVALVWLAGTTCNSTFADKPNFVIIFTDDQGYGDLSCYGSELIATPHIDRLADQGTRFTSFYAQVVCGPSRSALLTGRYPVRSQGWSMPASEITVAELLQQSGYRTCCVGKWDVSNRAAIVDRMPLAQGFDEYFGTLGANDNGKVTFHAGNEKGEQSADMASLTRIYTDRAIQFVEDNKERPFFLYLAHTMVHSVIDASPEFKGTSKGGLYGDTVQELDHHVGRLVAAIDKNGLSENTLIIFTTDNGPWSNAADFLGKRHGGQIAWGSAGPLREAKGSTYEGGLRVPCIARWPGHVPKARTSDAVFATIDFLPTMASIAGVSIPEDRLIDGVNQRELLTGKSETGARDSYAYFCQGELQAIRKGKWKVFKPNRTRFYGYVDDRGSPDAELYDLENDIGETTNLASLHPERTAELLKLLSDFPVPTTPYYPGIGLQRKAAGK
ncbi:MAG: sulfatase [Planctomycetaceae bacterium]